MIDDVAGDIAGKSLEVTLAMEMVVLG